MTLLAADRLNPANFFEPGAPLPGQQGSSFDLTIGTVYDNDGNPVDGPFSLKPGHIVQVVSAEIFKLPPTVTGHVTYKTTLTQKGIWALTVGIVDPGWNGPVATTLLNFSRVEHAVAPGDSFLRVSLFEHEEVPLVRLRPTPPLPEYLMNVRKAASTLFPKTFLNSDAISAEAGKNVMETVRNQALAWIAGIAILFTILQFAADFVSLKLSQPTLPPQVSYEAVDQLQRDLQTVKDELRKLRETREQTSDPGALRAKPVEAPGQPK
ncbi:dCTP deaminase domain-containing protein [Rhizobium leguminosarum]